MSSSRAAVALGLLALLAVPLAVAAAQVLSGVTLIQALAVAVVAALVLGSCAVAASRRARFALERSVRRDRVRSVRAGRVLAWAGLYVGVTAGVALAVYGVLRAAS
jgi:hypothetical protein